MGNKKKMFGLCFLAIFLWASGFPLTKVAQAHFSPFPLGFFRCAIGGVLLLLIGSRSHIRPPQKKHIPLFLLSGAFGFALYLAAYNTGMLTLPSATSSVIKATSPIITAIAATKLYSEKITRIGWGAIFSAFAGVLILLLWDGIFSINIGLLWTLLSAFFFSGYNLLNRRLTAMGYQALEIVAYSMLCGAVLLGFSSMEGFRQLASADMPHALALLYLAAFPSAAAYFFWGKAFFYAERTSEVTNCQFLVPFFSAVMAFFILHEIPNTGTVLGSAIIIASIVVFNQKGKA